MGKQTNCQKNGLRQPSSWWERQRSFSGSTSRRCPPSCAGSSKAAALTVYSGCCMRSARRDYRSTEPMQ